MKRLSIKIGLIFFVAFAMVLIAACCNKYKQQFNSYSLKTFLTGNVKYVFNPDTTFGVVNADTSNYQSYEYGIALKFEVEKYAVKDIDKDFSIDFITKSYALKCDIEHFMEPKDSLVNISIKTKEAFSTTNTAGSDVTNLFVTLENQYNPTRINKLPLSNLKFIPLYENGVGYYTMFFLYLNAAPKTPRDVQFDIEVTLSNGKVLNATTQKVFLN